MARIRESTGTATRTGPGRALLTLITPGKGSSGTYSAEMLEQAAKDRVFPRGTMSMVNHTTAMEDMERPEGDLRNLAGVLLEDARWEGGALVAEARIGSAWRSFVEEFGEFIGVSISAAAEIADDGTVNRLIPDPFNRADLVTVAGRGGSIAEVLEAARVIESRSIIGEAGNRDVRQWVGAAVQSAHGGNGKWVWLRDFDTENCWFDVDTDLDYDTHTKTYQQGYTIDGVEITLTGEPIEVRAHTEYTPVTTDSPSDPAGATEKKEAATMATIDDAELQTLRENAGRVTALEKELKDERDAREADARKAAEAAMETRQDRAVGVVKEAFGEDVPGYQINAARLAASADDFDHDKFEAEVKEAAAARESANGAGTPSGVGETRSTESAPKSYTDEDLINAQEGR